MKSLKGKNVVITGAASGIGKEIAVLFAKEKANLAIIDINKQNLEDTKKTLEQFDVNIGAYLCDVSSKNQIEETANTIKNDFNRVDILVNNAGIVTGKTIVDSRYEDIKRTIDVNLIGLIWMTKQFLPEMIDRNDGHIVNMASAMGLQAVPRMADYVATKFAIVGYSDTLRMEMKKYGHKGVKVTIICPSGTDTGMFEGYKPPLLTPLLKQAVVARKVIKAIKKEQTYLKIPFIVKTIPLLKGLFPASFLDIIADVLGLLESMDHFKGEPLKNKLGRR
jgi:all-trans-retinol dehydrogenase (NAD+)